MINLYVKLRNHTCFHLVLLLLILLDFTILPAQLLEGDKLVSFLIQPLSRSAYICSTKEEWNPLSPPQSPPPEIPVSHSSLKAHSKKQWWGILITNSKGLISSIWIYFPLNHKTFIIISLARMQESSAFALHQHLPEGSTTSLCQSACQVRQKHKGRLKFLDSLASGMALERQSHVPSPQKRWAQNQSSSLSNTFCSRTSHLLN